MPSYAAFLGHQPHISLAELGATVPGFLLKGVVDRAVVLFESAEPLTMGFLDRLGGIVIIAEAVEKDLALDDLPKLLVRQVSGAKGKVTFSIRSVGLQKPEIRGLYHKCKAYLKERGRPSRYVGNERAPAPSIVLRAENMLDGTGGCELCVVRHGEQLWIGVTVAAQDVEGYAKRDIGKPVRDTTTGLLPPKLAQVLINFGVWLLRTSSKPAPQTKLTVLDPFCGTGVIPMECMLRGFDVLASDKAEKAVTGCKKNLEWMRKHYDVPKSAVQSAVWKHDALKPFDPKYSADLIVTEGSLGPALRKRPTSKEVQALRAEAEDLQEKFLRSASTSFPFAPIVCIWPVWYTAKNPVFLERVWKFVDESGYLAILPPEVDMLQGRMSLLYRRPDQFVGREIVLLKPKRKK